MLQSIRQSQGNWDQAIHIVKTSVADGQKAIGNINNITKVWVREGPSRSTFLQKIKDIEASIADLGKKMDQSNSLTEHVFNHLLKTGSKFENDIYKIYQLIRQSEGESEELEIDFMIDMTSELEQILVDQKKPNYLSYTTKLSPLTPRDIESLDPSLTSNFKSALQEFRTTFQGHKVTCFASYDRNSKSFVQMVVADLKLAGVDVVFDLQEGPDLGRDISKLEGKILKTDYVIVFGTRSYGDKTRSDVKSGVKDEAPLVVKRFSTTRQDVILFLLEGTPFYSFPDLMNTDRFGYADCRKPSSYFPSVIRALERLYSRIAEDAFREGNQQLLNFIAEKKTLFPLP